MKKINSIIIAFASLALTTTSCNDFLDKLPDDRAEVNTSTKIKQLLVSAYPTHSVAFLNEYSSDNVTDNGKTYTYQPNQDKVYRFEQVETTGNDDPKNVWRSHYEAVYTANEALSAIETVGLNEETKPLKAEALLCRAFAVFQLTNTFCMAYDSTKAGKEYYGLPYPKSNNDYITVRGTLEETYENINNDIEEALPLLDDTYLSVPAYHFNAKAAYAFAARFNLYYHRYDKAIKYATKALGNNVSSVLRNVKSYSSLAGVDDINNAYINSGETANLLLMTAYSIHGRAMYSSSFRRYAHSREITTYETFWAYMPWALGATGATEWSKKNGSTNNTLLESHCLYGNSQVVYYPKYVEHFEYTDKVNGTGYAHTIDAVFTTDEALLVRAESYIMKKDYSNALVDLNYWVDAHCANYGAGVKPELTTAVVDTFYKSLPDVTNHPESDIQRGTKKPLHPQGFTVESGTQTNLIQLVLQMRRIETWRQGMRFQDVKRWGIEYSHNLDGEEDLIFKAGDLRGAIQLPIDAINAGLEANPR
mgnify:CR=1 FL=1